MGGKGEVNEAVRIKATQDQLRLARITQDTSSIEEEKMNIQKLIKKVTETTQCTTGQAETALYDADYNVEVAVNAILEQSYPDENVWTEQKSRKTRRAEAEERAEAEQLANQRSRNYTARAQNSYSGMT
ncbi:hypothetical protein AB6A40_005207 [Gnathostoma spinigerum]|uniref:Uncharacterized protein n=1 Tax=Gnathostoma spinigerum TaxID=75299 RepID=A0ABD6EEX5_9BILA